ncbi:unnamed protein product [Closterium sp. NIES-64]|nr:unnamed protein product [Closterium sp. NIES-64]
MAASQCAEMELDGSPRTAEEIRAEERQPAEIGGSRAPPGVRAAGDARLLRSCFDGLARGLDHALRTATTSQQHDAIATCLLIANMLCDWPDSDEPRPWEAFGFHVLRSMPDAAESRGKPWASVSGVVPVLSPAQQRVITLSVQSTTRCLPSPLPPALVSLASSPT